MKGRLPEEFRQRAKRYAAEAIRLFVKLPKEREEIRGRVEKMLQQIESMAVAS